VDAAFRGFQALPMGSTDGIIMGEVSKKWYEILGVDETANKEEIRSAFKILAQMKHPDLGGTDVEFKELMNAYQEGLRMSK